jgi:uncharacterized membrane protein YkvI
MKKIGSLQIAFTIAGGFFGAGFISGQELWQFFGSFGMFGLLGMVLACILLCFLSFLTINYAFKTNIFKTEKIIVPCNIKWLEKAAYLFEISFLFFIYVIMISGAGSLIYQVTNNYYLRLATTIIFSLFVTLVALKGPGSAVKLFDIIAPLLTIVTIVVVTVVLVKNKSFGFYFPTIENENPLLNNWVFSFLTFVAYNIFCIIPILASLGGYIKSSKDAFLGSTISSVCILIVAVFILMAICAVPNTATTELPLLALADELGVIGKMAVTVILSFSMFGAAISVYVPVPDFFKNYKVFNKHKILFTSLISVVAVILSSVNFSSLISVIYPIYGYISLFAIIGLIVNTVILHKKKI